jgi:membrane fusion protein (multidrug efflux system)
MNSRSSKTDAAGRKRSVLAPIIKLAIVLVAVIGLVALALAPGRQTETAPGEPPPVNVTVMPVQAIAALPDSFTLPAVVEPNAVVTVAAEVPGRIEWIGPTEGAMVQVGDPLVRLNRDLLKAEFERAEAQAKYDRTEYNRKKGLVEGGAAPDRELDEAAMKLAISNATLEEIRARLDRTRIVAPLTGVLNDLPVEEGEYVQPGMPVATIIDGDPVKVVVKVPERDVPFFRVGDTAEVEVTNPTADCDTVVDGTITFISELADERTRSTRMEITLPNADRCLRSGQVVRVRLQRRVIEDAILIPLLAVIPMEEGNAVYVVESSEAQRREVQLGIIRGDRVQIRSGLAPGDQLIVAGHRFVAPGQKVNISATVPEGE